MRHLFTAAVLGAATLAAPAMAWNDTQPATNEMAIWAYPSKHNYCPAGLQPVMVGGVVCCGTPTHHGNPYAHPTPAKHKPRTHAPVVQYGKGASDVVVYGKGE